MEHHACGSDIDDVHKGFGTVQALEGVSFSLNRGEWLALLGPNGAGKTTLVRAVAGRVRLDHGSISLDDCLLDQSAAADKARAKLGIVGQDIALYPLLTASENLEVWGSLHGLSGASLVERVQWALDWTGLEDRAGEMVKKYSGGMRRRLNIACGVLHDPEILLLDEPTVGVDPQSRQRIWEMLEGLHARGVSMLLTTHQLDEAQQLCARIVIIDHGRVIADGTFEQLVEKTVGPERRLTLHVDGGIPDSLRQTGFEVVDESVLRWKVDNVAEELPGLLAGLSTAGVGVRELSIESPTLQEVFIHLTGRELRE